MEGEEIGLVLARASELRSRIGSSIDRCGGGGTEEAVEAEDEESEILFSIRDALESLEQQLAALQDLQQQQRYEREATLSRIDRSRMILLSKLKEYKGEDLELIHEALTFAGESPEHDDSLLLLPPYSSHLPASFVLDDLYHSSRVSSKDELARKGLTADRVHEAKKSVDESEIQRGPQHANRNKPKGARLVLGWFAKSVITFLGVLSALSLAGFKPTLRKSCNQFKLMEFLRKLGDGEGGGSIQCPPGKVLVVEDGKSRCIVKERVEVPFESEVTAPSISYGFG